MTGTSSRRCHGSVIHCSELQGRTCLLWWSLNSAAVRQDADMLGQDKKNEEPEDRQRAEAQ